jgi:MFS transporter, DHA3 family, macrolide efflux protein
MIDMSEVVIQEPASTPKEKLWTKTFFLLWQGQFVSALGDVVYGLALGFWVLAVTGSTALMGTLMAASILPGVLISPLAGVIVDRNDRKNIMILMDGIRGICIVLVGIAAYNGLLSIWMVFIAGILLSICGAFFHPAANSVLPDIVPKDKLTNANSIFSMIMTGSNIVGSSTGGFIFQTFGAPFMFLFNGISFLFSGFSILFAKIPKHKPVEEKQHFMTDMKDGFKFVWRFKGLRYLLIMASFLNFLSFVGIVLILPLFQKTASLGAAKYGVSVAFMTGGMLLGYVITSIIKIPSEKKAIIFMASAAISNICFMLFPILLNNYILMNTLVVFGGMFNAIINVFIMSSVQATVPQNMRGKVFSLLGMIAQGLTPLGMALGGVLGEIISIPAVISASFLLTLLLFIPFTFSKEFWSFIKFDPKIQKLEDINQS